jgi:hypothetical protein
MEFGGTLGLGICGFHKPKQQVTLEFAKAGRTEAVFELLFFNLSLYRAGRY